MKQPRLGAGRQPVLLSCSPAITLTLGIIEGDLARFDDGGFVV
jgi:hypothetical protein